LKDGELAALFAEPEALDLDFAAAAPPPAVGKIATATCPKCGFVMAI